MVKRINARWLIGVASAVAIVITGAVTTSVNAQESSPSSLTNPDQADGPGIITVQQVNMCMWGSRETPGCFANPYQRGEPGWERAERATAAKKRDSVVTQYERHIPDVFTVSEGCRDDLKSVADTIGYQIRYVDTGDGTDGKPRQCTVDRGPAVNAILAKTFTDDGPKGYFEDQGYRSYVCAQVSTTEWKSVRVCTAHLSLGSQGDHREIECGKLRNILDDSDGYVIFAGDVNMKRDDRHCAPTRFHGLKNTEHDPDDNTALSGLEHIYYSANGFWRQSCGWSYQVGHTDHRGFLLELGKSKPDDRGDCWRHIR